MVSFVVANNATINIIIHGIVAALIAPLLIHLLYKLSIAKPEQSSKKRDMEPRMKKLTCLFSLFFIPQLIANLFTEIYSDGDHAKQRTNWNIAMNVFYLLVNVCLYLVIIQRYHITFKDSAYSSGNWLYIFLIGLIIVYFIVYSSFFVIYATKGHWFPAIDAYKIYIFVDIIMFILLWTISTWSWILNDNDPTAPILPTLTNTLHAFLIPLDIITNFLCIYLNFDFTKRFYRCICCGFDKCCLTCCKCITELRIVKEEQREFELSQTRYRLLSEK